MRIAIVGTELCAVDEWGGGLEQVLRRWARYLAGNHEVTLVSHRPVGAPPVGATPGVPTVVTSTPALAETLAQLAPDVVSLHNRPQWVARVPRGATPTVTFHNYPPAWKLGRAWPRPPCAVSAVSRALGDAAAHRLGRPPEQVAWTPPSIDPAFFTTTDPPGSRTDGWAGPVVFSPNRLLRKKGVRELLDVAARAASFERVTFAFVDLISPWTRPTAEHRALRSAIAATPNAILWPAMSSAAELAASYAAAAVVVCPVREEEGLGLVALEAQAVGTPLVTTDLGGLREATFPPNQCVPAGDPQALAAAIAAALAEPKPCDEPRHQVLLRHTPEASGAAMEVWLTASRER